MKSVFALGASVDLVFWVCHLAGLFFCQVFDCCVAVLLYDLYCFDTGFAGFVCFSHGYYFVVAVSQSKMVFSGGVFEYLKLGGHETTVAYCKTAVKCFSNSRLSLRWHKRRVFFARLHFGGCDGVFG